MNLCRHPLAWDMTPGHAYKGQSGVLLIEFVRQGKCRTEDSPRFLR